MRGMLQVSFLGSAAARSRASLQRRITPPSSAVLDQRLEGSKQFGTERAVDDAVVA